MTDLPRFDVRDPLPDGTVTLLEASAGTGKTYALSALAVRMVAEQGIPISRILIVTFTRAATAELRDRIRRSLIDGEAHLRSDPHEDCGDPILDALAAGPPAERALRIERLSRAVREFDTATISTIHGFCSIVLGSLGVLAERNLEGVAAERGDDLVRQVCGDLLFTAQQQGPAPTDLAQLVKLVTRARSLPGCAVTAEAGDPAEVAVADLVEQAVLQVERRLQSSGALSYDSLLTEVRDALLASPTVPAEVRSQFDAALIDEFQDTDPVQWEIFQTLFGRGTGVTLVLVGDPKQAIYAFRGGDVYTYLAARNSATSLSLGTNQRSDEPVVRAMNVLASGQQFGEPEISYHQVDATKRHGRRALLLGGLQAPGLEVRCLYDPEAVRGGKLSSPSVRGRIAEDLGDLVCDLLQHGTLRDKDDHERPVVPGDIAVLVGATFETEAVAEALRSRNVPVVVRAGDNVADSEAASQWASLLHALDRPASTPRALAVALGWFFGWSATDVATAMEEQVGSAVAERVALLQQTLHDWAELLSTKGMPALLGAVRRQEGVMERLLGAPLGERNVTDLEHVAELVHAESVGGRGISPAAALMVLTDLGGTASDELAADAVQRRIESDADAVQVQTIHSSKGLEFPIVLLPSLWSGGKRVGADKPFTYFDPALGRRRMDVSTPAPLPRPTKAQPDPTDPFRPRFEATAQNCGDQHRLTYVAMTRAVHMTVAWWAPMTHAATGTAKAGLTRLLFADGTEPAGLKIGLPSGSDVLARVAARLAPAGDAARVVEVGPRTGPVPRYQSPSDPDADGQLRAASIDRELSRAEHRWSFTQLIKHSQGARHAQAGADPAEPAGDDRQANDETAADLPAAFTPAPEVYGPEWTVAPAMEGLGGGTSFGNLVHEMFEHLDFTDPDLPTAIAEWLRSQRSFLVSEDQVAQLPDLLAASVRTPFGPHFGELSLSTLTLADRLNELHFFLPISPGGSFTARRIGEVIADHLGPGTLKDWAVRLAAGLEHVDLTGFMSGSIDLTLRFDGSSGSRYSVVDFKTNRLTRPGAAATLADYHPDVLPAAMCHSNYVLQALLYNVALHRYLRWRLGEAYAPSAQLGPVGYLFVRGMVGPESPRASDGTPSGVFAWQPPSGLVESLSDLLAGAEVSA